MATLYYRPYTSDLQNDDPDNNETRMSYRSDKDANLPEFQYIFQQGSNETESTFEDEDEQTKYRLAIRRMSTEIVHLREKIRDMADHRQSETVRHCHVCTTGRPSNDNSARLVIGELVDVNSISKEELLKRYLLLKDNHDQVSTDLNKYQEKVHTLQKELIRKNERETEFLRISKAHSTQNALMHDMQKKVARIKQLETTIKEQETIISKMEKQLDKNRDDGSKKKSRKLSPITEINSSRSEEVTKLQKDNRTLKQEIESIKTMQMHFPKSDSMNDSERLELYQLLDKAESRILSLQKQISHTHREKQKDHKARDNDTFGFSKINF